MELKEFIKGVLLDITDAVKESQEEIKNGAIISPADYRVLEKVSINGSDLIVSHIDFEIAISADTTTEKSNGIGGRISVLSAFIGGKSEEDERVRNENISKIKFSIPLVLPSILMKEKQNRY